MIPLSLTRFEHPKTKLKKNAYLIFCGIVIGFTIATMLVDVINKFIN